MIKMMKPSLRGTKKISLSVIARLTKSAEAISMWFCNRFCNFSLDCFATLAITIMLSIFIPFVSAQDEPAMPRHRDYVNDFANIIDSGDEAAIRAFAQELDSKTTAQIAVVTIPTTKPLTIEQYAVKLFEKWGIGTKAKDNGVLILMAVNDKKVRIETGYGMEGAIPDAIASQIVNQIMIPRFKQGSFSQGMVYGAVAVAQLAAKEYDIELTGTASYGNLQPRKSVSFVRFIFTLFLFLMFFSLRMGLLPLLLFGSMGHRRGGMWYGSGYGGSRGGFSGGFGGFGGGFSGGGGASGGW